jgi:hypothetical protein
LADERGKEWQLQKEFVKQWTQVNCNRIMDVRGIFEQNDKKLHPPDWVLAPIPIRPISGTPRPLSWPPVSILSVE